jgi:hypothetical protein
VVDVLVDDVVDRIAAGGEHAREGEIGDGLEAEGEAHEWLCVLFVKSFTK